MNAPFPMDTALTFAPTQMEATSVRVILAISLMLMANMYRHGDLYPIWKQRCTESLPYYKADINGPSIMETVPKLVSILMEALCTHAMGLNSTNNQSCIGIIFYV